MIEVEIKARCGPDVHHKILALGASALRIENHRDIYFNSQVRDFKGTDEALRIRIKEDGAHLTYKGPKLDRLTKTRLELTSKIEGPEVMEKILVELGFVPSGEVRKRRIKYSLGETILAVDEVEGLGLFLEIEISAEEDWAMKRKCILDLKEHLGLGESIRKSYLELLDEARLEIGHPDSPRGQSP